MNTKLEDRIPSRVAALWGSFSPSSRAAMWLALPLSLVDGLHYLTAGTALAVSLPLLAVLYLGCGMLAGGLAGGDGGRHGLLAGMKLWLISTVANALIGLLVGALSLGATLLVGVPYMLLCAPVNLALGALMGALGEALWGFLRRRSGAGA